MGKRCMYILLILTLTFVMPGFVDGTETAVDSNTLETTDQLTQFPADTAPADALTTVEPITDPSSSWDQSLQSVFDPTPSRGRVVRVHKVNVMDFGTVGDGLTDDTQAIQNAIDSGSLFQPAEVFIPDGTYLINPDVSIELQDNTSLILSPNAILQAKGSAASYNTVIKISNKSNVKVAGGQIVGERYKHLGTVGAQGSGIRITGSSNVFISDISINDCWGDGIYIGSNPSRNYSQNIIVERVRTFNNRRNGITVISAKNLVIRNSELTNSNGNLPQSGLCLEPNDSKEFMENILVDHVTTSGNAGYGINFYVRIKNPISVTIRDFDDEGSIKGSLNDYARHYITKHSSSVTLE